MVKREHNFSLLDEIVQLRLWVN